MSLHFDRMTRRALFESFASCSLLARVGNTACAQNVSVPSRVSDPMTWAPRDLDNLISDPQEALDVFDFEPVAQKNLPPAHFGYIATGIDDEVTRRANRAGFMKFQLRSRRLIEVAEVDISTEIIGLKYDSPIVTAPTGSDRAFHQNGEVALSNAAKIGNHLQILSSSATTSIEEAIAARDAPVGFSCMRGSGR